MICPLLTICCQARTPNACPLHDCIQQECAWWDDDKGGCAIRTVLDDLHDVRTALLVQSGHEEMPRDW